MENVWLCSACSEVRAHCFCPCIESDPFLCRSCISLHCTKRPQTEHRFLPIVFYGAHKDPGFYQRYEARVAEVNNAKCKLKQNLDEVDNAIQEFTAQVQKVMNALWEYGQETIVQLQQVKGELQQEIDTAIEEVDRTLYEENPELLGELSILLRTNCGVDAVKLFHHEIAAFPEDVRSIVRISYRKQRFQPRISLLPQFKDRTLRVTDINSKQTIIHELKQTFTNWTTFCTLDAVSVIAVGGFKPISAAADSVQLQTGEIRSLPRMRAGRGAPGVAKWGSFVYVFGGLGETVDNLQSCECFSIPQCAWMPLPDMKVGKDSFTPCVYRDDIYLPVQNQQLEAFNVPQQKFRLLQVRFTTPGADWVKGVVSFIAEDSIISITRDGHAGMWKMQENEDFLVADLGMSSSVKIVSSFSPISVGRKTYWVNFAGERVEFNLDNLSVSAYSYSFE